MLMVIYRRGSRPDDDHNGHKTTLKQMTMAFSLANVWSILETPNFLEVKTIRSKAGIIVDWNRIDSCVI